MPDQVLPAFQPLSDRMAGLPLDETLHEGVPEWLETPLRDWLRAVLTYESVLARRVTLRLHRSPGRQDYVAGLINCSRGDILDVVDAVLQLHPAWPWLESQRSHEQRQKAEEFAKALFELQAILYDGSSLYGIDFDERRLSRRVDETVRAAVEQAVASTSDTTAKQLRAAWTAAYGMHPDPDTAYREAVRAVENVACPLVLPNASKPTLGRVLDHLRSAGQKWQIVLVNKDGDPDISPLIAMLDRLWTGQVSRHGGGGNSREQTQAEAEAAVHLAAVLVHWLSSGVLTKR